MDNNSHTFYICYQLEKDSELNGNKIVSGFYRYTYDLSGVDVPNPCQYSKDRYEWTDCTTFKSLAEFQDFFDKKIEPKPIKFEQEDYIETMTYRGKSVPIFNDDYGQCFYCIFNNEVLSFGSFQPDYEDEVKSLIDYEIDKRPPNISSSHA